MPPPLASPAKDDNEIARFRPLLDQLDLADTVVTDDALHTQREHAEALDAPVPGSPSATNLTRWAPCSIFESTTWSKLAAP
jgi:hypothetical protein